MIYGISGIFIRLSSCWEPSMSQNIQDVDGCQQDDKNVAWTTFGRKLTNHFRFQTHLNLVQRLLKIGNQIADVLDAR